MANDILKGYFSAIGRRGGSAKSAAKHEAGCRNLEKARQARLKKKQAKKEAK